MRPMFVVSAGVTLLLIAAGPGSALAGGRGRARSAQSAADAGKDKETSASFNHQFQWEEKVVGPKDKGVDHEKIAAMQEQGRREEQAKRRDQGTGQPKKTPRADGIGGPASATLPTMDIEKPAPAGSIRSPVRRASYTPPPRHHDDIDNVLAENSAGSASDSPSGQDGLSKLLASPSRASARPAAKRAKHSRARHRRR
jgi:hypothetical protein